MTKTEKALLIIVAIITALLLGAYMLIHHITVNQTESVVYPAGSLSNSLFVSQNNTYEKNDSLPNTYSFKRIPFKIDLPEGSTANVGDSTIVRINDSYYIYVSEHDEYTTAQTLFLQEFPSAIMMDYSQLYTYADTMTSQTGYINGSSADYEFDLVNISDGTTSTPVYTAIYDVKQLEKSEYASRIVLAAVTTNTDNESLASAKALIDAIMKTFRYDEDLDKQMENSGSEYRTGEEQMSENADGTEAGAESTQQTGDDGIGEVSETDEKPEASDSENSQSGANSLITSEDEDAALKGVKIEAEYEDLYVHIFTSSSSPYTVMTLYTPGYSEITEKTVSEDYTETVFHVGKVTEDLEGRYILKLTYQASAGSISMKLEDAADVETTAEGN